MTRRSLFIAMACLFSAGKVSGFDPTTQAFIDLSRRVKNVEDRMRATRLPVLVRFADELQAILAGGGAVQGDKV